jgi:hypothetical protein
MENLVTRRQRPLFHDGPDWQQLDVQLRRQLIERLANICHCIVGELPSHQSPCEQEQPDDARKD